MGTIRQLINLVKILRMVSGQGFLTRRGRKSEPEVQSQGFLAWEIDSGFDKINQLEVVQIGLLLDF